MVRVNIFEQLVKEFYEVKGYFLKENFSYGRNREADLLGINIKGECIHIEVTERKCSSYEMNDLITKKFDNEDIKQLYNELFGKTKVKKVYVVWWLKDASQLMTLNTIIKPKIKVKIISFQDIFDELSKYTQKTNWSTTKNKISSMIKMHNSYLKSLEEGREGK